MTPPPHPIEDADDLDALQRIDPRLVALALGRIDDDELDELMDRAVREPEVRRAVDAFWPLDESVKRLSFARAQAALEGRERGPSGPHWSLLFLPAGVTASVVVGIAVLVVGALAPGPLPSYELDVRGGFRSTRSDRRSAAEASGGLILRRLAPGAPVELLFRPANPVQGTAHAAIFRVGSDGPVRLDVAPEVSESGSVRWRGTITSLLQGGLGVTELVVAVQAGRPPTRRDVQWALVEPRPTIRLQRAIIVLEDR